MRGLRIRQIVALAGRPLERFQCPEQVGDGASEPVEPPDGNHIETPLVRICHRTVKL
jgi:hypothetical protein